MTEKTSTPRILGREMDRFERELWDEQFPSYDDDGRRIELIFTCGTCHRSWNDAAISLRTPTPSGRCPFEYEHEEEPETDLQNEY